MSDDDISITPEKFVQELKDLQESLVEDYFSFDSEISRIRRLKESGFNESQIELTKGVVNEVLTDALYTVLLGLEGSASIHKHQIMYKLLDEESNELTGEIEPIAWEKFHGQDT